MGETVFILALGGAGFALFARWVWKAIRTGVLYGAAGPLEKARRPILFWMTVVIYGVLAILCVVVALQMLML